MAQTTAKVTRSRGEATASRLEELYVRYGPGAVSLAYLLTGDRHLAEDLAQEAFVRVAGRFQHLRSAQAFDAYLRRAVVNLFTSHLRRRRLERAWAARHREDRVAPAAPDVEERDEVWRALRQLPERQRAALVLRFYEDLSERETAEVLRCSTAAAKSLVARGMEGLRQILGSGSEER